MALFPEVTGSSDHTDTFDINRKSHLIYSFFPKETTERNSFHCKKHLRWTWRPMQLNSVWAYSRHSSPRRSSTTKTESTFQNKKSGQLNFEDEKSGQNWYRRYFGRKIGIVGCPGNRKHLISMQKAFQIDIEAYAHDYNVGIFKKFWPQTCIRLQK